MPPATSAPISFGPNPARVIVTLMGTEVAHSERALRLNEKGLAPVYYLPRADVDTALLEASATRSHCPHKGDASYWSLVLGGARFDDAVWSYETPLAPVAAIAGHMAFWAERVGPALSIEVVT